jgi:hypothetical protein
MEGRGELRNIIYLIHLRRTMAQGWTAFREIMQIKRENMELSKQRMENMQYTCKECSMDNKVCHLNLNEREKEILKLLCFKVKITLSA